MSQETELKTDEIKTYKTQSEAIEAARKSAPLARRIAWKGLIWSLICTCCSIILIGLFAFFTPKHSLNWISNNLFSVMIVVFFITFFISLIIWLGSFLNWNRSSSCYDDEDDYIRNHDSSHNSDYYRDIITNPAYSSLSSNVHHRH